jgi:cleavage and polyadenylation specificity factor subunit 1
MAFSIAKHGERMVPELVCAMGVPTCVTSSTQGAEALDQSVGEGGFICFQRDVPTRLKKKLHALGGGKGMWALSLRKPALATEKGKEKERSKERERKHSVEAEAGELMVAVLSTDANPSPGLSRVLFS